jgi:hypothetical protein
MRFTIVTIVIAAVVACTSATIIPGAFAHIFLVFHQSCHFCGKNECCIRMELIKGALPITIRLYYL